MDLLDKIMSDMEKTRPAEVKEKKTERSNATPLANQINRNAGLGQGAPGQLRGQPPTPTSGGMPSFRIPKKRSSEEPPGPANKRFQSPAVITPQNFRPSGSVDVKINAYSIDLSRVDVAIKQIVVNVEYHFEVGGRPKTYDLTVPKARNDHFDVRRRVGMFELMQNLIVDKKHEAIFGSPGSSPNVWKHKYIYDGFSTLYVSDDHFRHTWRNQTIDVPCAELPQSIREGLIDRAPTKCIVNLTQSEGQIYLKGDRVEPKRVETFLEVLTSQMIHTGSHMNLRNGIFSRDNRNEKPLGEGKMIKSGFQKSVRFLGPNASPCLFVDVCTSAFFRESSVVDFFCKYTKCRDGRQLEEALRRGDSTTRNAFEFASRELKGLIVVTTHQPRNSDFIVADVNKKSARKTMFQRGDEMVSVADYFVETRKMRLEFPDLPVIVQRRGASLSFFPMEVLRIVGHQRVAESKLRVDGNVEDFQKDKMIDASRCAPNQYYNISRDAFASLRVSNRNPYLDALKVTIANEARDFKALVLNPPDILFKGERVKPSRGKINKNSRNKYFRTAVIKKMAVIFFDGYNNRDLVPAFYRHAKAAGIEISPSVDKCQIFKLSSELHDDLDAKMKSLKGEGFTYLLAITAGDDRRPAIHDYLKLFEANHMIQTHQITGKTADKLTANGGATVDNTMHKLNLKGGGLNFSIAVPESACGPRRNEMQKKLFEETMFVGFDFSHASAQSAADRQLRTDVDEPSIVGVSFTLGDPAELSGFSWKQTARDHQMQNLHKAFPDVLRQYHKSSGKLPAKIVIYRSGVGEGGLEFVMEEIGEMKKSLQDPTIKKLWRSAVYAPKFTVMLVQKKSNYRVFEKDGNNVKNVPPGTFLTAEAMSTSIEEFLLVSQEAIIGTARPTRFAIAVNEAALTIEELANVTFYMAYGHQVSFKPPGIPDVVYAAENHAKRGRNNFLTERKYKMESDKKPSPPVKEEYENDISEMLSRFHFGHMFWA